MMKMLTCWNALMLQGYTDAYRAFEKSLSWYSLKWVGSSLKNAEGNRLDRNYKDE